MPQEARLTELTRAAAVVDRDLALARSSLSDVEAEVSKAEADVQLVRDRAARDRARLDSGTGSPKDLQALQSELVSLARRQNELEELELEVMERAEALGAEVARLEARHTGLRDELADARADRDTAVAALDAETADIQVRRGALTPLIAADLLALYDKIRGSADGVGAAELRQRRCGGCRLELNQVEVSRFRTAPPDEVLRCDECRRILVRTPESGL